MIAYITRTHAPYLPNAATHELLVFAHQGMPEVPIQVPAGTIDPGETPEAALFQEIWEESGLTDIQLCRKLGVQHLVLKGKPRQQHYFIIRSHSATGRSLGPSSPGDWIRCWTHLFVFLAEDRSGI